MKVNTGTIERIIRVVAGLTLIGFALTDRIGIWGWIGVIPVATGLFGICPAYSLLGINTCATKK